MILVRLIAKNTDFLPQARNVVDAFSDGSVYLVDSSGYLECHLNLLARLARLTAGKFLYSLEIRVVITPNYERRAGALNLEEYPL
jgi:hypothetical protein